MSNAAPVQDETEDRYYTQVEEGDVRLFTLDQLDAAFNAGLIHENTYVCLEGDSKWLTLAEVAGLGGEEEAEPVSAPHPIAAPAPVQSYIAPAPAYSVPAPAPVSPVASGPFGLAPVTNSIAPTTNSVAPMIMPSTPPAFTNSLALDDDLELMAMRRKRAPLGKILAAVAVLGLGGVAFAVVQSGGIRLPKLNDGVAQASAASLSVSSLKQAEPSKAETPPPAPAPEPVAEAAKPEPAKEEAKSADATDSADKKQNDDRFSEEMKAALLAKDKDSGKKAAPGKKASKKPAARAVAARGGSKAKAAGGFKSSGNAYDPLNGKL